MWCRGIRGATRANSNTKEDIIQSTTELLREMIQANEIEAENVASAMFTTTPDLDAEFPAVAARQLGWEDTALMCGHEMNVPGSLSRCIRILIHLNTTKTAAEIRHVYTRGAEILRPSLSDRSRS
ncbi:MAG: chorismate mutase [Chloroflexi bacterium]|nr:chorismate mutase [Chloroflexota bacterium]